MTKKTISNFQPIITDLIFDLRPDEITWTKNYHHGVFAFYKKKGKRYFGISFQQDSARFKETVYLWEIPRKFHLDLPEVTKRKQYPRQKVVKDSEHYLNWDYTPAGATKFAKGITCQYPQLPGTFQVIAAPEQQLEVFEKLLNLASLIEELLERERLDSDDCQCDRLRAKLNQEYNSFINQYGLISNFSSYFKGAWWVDLRLCALVGELERVSKEEGTSRRITKTDIFTTRQSYPPNRQSTIVFSDRDLGTRVTKALNWCQSWYGTIDIAEIAKRTNLDPQLIESQLRDSNLVYRNVTGILSP